MNRFNVLLKSAVDKAGGKLAQRHIEPEVMLAVFFDHDEHMRFFNDYFSKNFRNRGEEVAGKALVFRCDNEQHANDVAEHLDTILENLEDKYERSGFRENWLQEHLKDSNMGIWDIQVFVDDISTEEGWQLTLDKVRADINEHNEYLELLNSDAFSKSHADILDEWVSNVMDNVGYQGWKAYVHDQLGNVLKAVSDTFDRHPRVIQSEVDKMLSAITYRAVMSGNTNCVLSAEKEMLKLNKALPSMGSTASVHLYKENQKLIHDAAVNLEDDLSDTLASIGLPISSEVSEICQKDGLSPENIGFYGPQKDFPGLSYVLQFANYLLMTMTVHRTKNVQRRVVEYAKDLTPDSDITGFVDRCLFFRY